MQIATIDFEASGTDGYPIEVGIAIYDSQRAFLSIWSTLIKPTVGWLRTMNWDPVAAQIHGITRAEISTATSAFDVARQLNELLAPIGVAYCDGWNLDTQWLNLLMVECPEHSAFHLNDAGALARALAFPPSALFEHDQDPPLEHRAASDAERLLRRALRFAGQDEPAACCGS